MYTTDAPGATSESKLRHREGLWGGWVGKGGNEVTLSDDPSAQKTVDETKSHKAGGQIDKARCSSLSLCGNGKRPHLFA